MKQRTAMLDSYESAAEGPLKGEGAVLRRETLPSESWRLLLVENDAGEAETLAGGLRRQGHQVEIVGTAGEALRLHPQASLVLLDLELPDLDGLEVCRGIRTVSKIPVIVVTARCSELDRVLGLQAGADDYLAKPYGFRELMARIDAVMRRAGPTASATATAGVITRGALRIDAGAREVTLDGKRVETTRKEFDVLLLLASHPDTVIPRKVLMEQVWGDSWSRRTVDTHVSSLRNKLGTNWIVTIRGVGFRFGQG
ncbi:Sensory transduction protein regX3 [Streptomyces sp. KY75]|nr:MULTISPECIES: response regulator transcription factor [Streptomyces]ONI53595.1 Transcriptional regulatory protein YycF [Streptomyces sp. IB2014 011-1]RDV47966.1 DNA-binding response regulator [Streptomyces sp. IB2014 011-12]CAD5931373.1 Sensory transduction protein regX3 [Streptomyces sp. KY70]CAD5988751.1 Sensory transduction protein regX3 [Streptomyces sp. KY75]